MLDLLAPGVLLALGVAERPGDVAHRRPGPVGDDVGDLRGVLAAVLGVDVLDHLLAPVGLDVDVDVRRPVRAPGPGTVRTAGRSSTESTAVMPMRVADRGVGGRCPGPGQRMPCSRQNSVELPDHQEVAGKAELVDDRQLVLDLAVAPARCAAACAGRTARAAPS